MRRIVVVVVVAALGAGYALYSRSRPQPDAAPPVTGEPIRAPDQIVAEARVVPVRGVTLSFPTGGTVAQVLVREGQAVGVGQVLVRLEAARQAQAAIAQAEAVARAARARAAELRAGPRPQDVAAAQAALQAAQARYDQLVAGAREQERGQARAAVEQAEQRAAAAAQRVTQAEAALQLAHEDLRRMEQLLAQQAVAQQSVDQARARVATAHADLDAARAEVAAARAAATAARQQLSLVQSGPRREEIEAAAAEVRRARAQLELLRAGARPQAVAAAEADAASAQAAVRQARVRLEDAQLRAPFAGTVAWLGPAVGEFVAPGAPVARLGDLSRWEVETVDLTELSIVNVRVGSRATVRFDGIPGLELPGRVRQINVFGENRLGDITYKVVVALERQDPRLRWNMTATVAITR